MHANLNNDLRQFLFLFVCLIVSQPMCNIYPQIYFQKMPVRIISLKMIMFSAFG